MNRTPAFYGLFFLVVLAALLFRVSGLELRPMHHDEANQAVKFGSLLEEGKYRYDPTQHHGPSLYYLTLPFAWIGSGTSFASLSKVTLRLVPAVFGAAIILMLLLLKDGYSPPALFFSGILAAVSPVMVYYNRFYIQETLLVFFLVGAIASGWRYLQERRWGWAAAAGFFSGMMFATKETCIILFAAATGSLVLVRVLGGSIKSRENPESKEKNSRRATLVHLLVFGGTALAVSILFFSSFFQNPRGILDSVLAFKTYFGRAAGAGFHSHPFPYYLKMLAYSRYGNGPVWSEALVLILALVGCAAVFLNRSQQMSERLFLRFTFFFTILATAIYSLIPYKTPWNILPFYIGIILLAGQGVVFLLNLSRKVIVQSLVILILGVGLCHLGLQSYRANFIYSADPRNPYVYAQTSPDFNNLVQRVEEIARFHPEHKQMLIKVITHPDEAWPLPWYLRSFGKVGYWQEVEEAGPLSDVPLIISSTDKVDRLQLQIRDSYQSEYYGLRPEVLLALHIRKDLWDKFIKERTLK
ncbi:MAG: TIGR03663 family protein [Candidatus Aminicenantes bacterium]|nr:TIGR03663 family protein [Candidatus Aminicenantes bacterium]